jgi:hypothetical protein
MAATLTIQPQVRVRTIPWYLWCSVAAVTCAMVGTQWDISWHRSIGRDSFWTPAHICIHLCGILAGFACAWLILTTTFSHDSPLRAASVKIWGFRGPLGAFIAAWGGIAMLTSAPFDDWWHNAYGLDVKILSPPHMVLAAGILAVHLGGLILILGYMNRADEEWRRRLEWLYLYVAGMMVVCFTTVEMELTSRSQMHGGMFYRVIAMVVPLVLAGAARGSGRRWAATIVASIYFVFILLMSWILPLFPATPKLGPVYVPVTQFIPPEFPLLLVVPAFVLDLFWDRTRDWNQWLVAAISGALFVGAFMAAQWPFANFLMSGAARNWFFGSKYFGYYLPPTSNYFRYLFYPEAAAVFWKEIAIAITAAFVTTRFGLMWGTWMQRIRR